MLGGDFVRAQTQNDVPIAENTAADTTSETTTENTDNPHKQLNDLYAKPTYKNLLNLYWRNSKLDVKNPRDLDLYLIVGECEITKKYRQNDFEWADIRKATADYILSNKAAFNNHFRVVQPIQFGEYDFGRAGFAILPDFQYKGLKYFRISNNVPDERNCSARMILNENPGSFAPYNAAVQLDMPYSLTYVPMDKELSQRYLDYVSGLVKKNGGAGDRIAYVTFYLTLNGFLGTNVDSSAQSREISVYSATIDYISVSADKEGQYPLYTKRVRQE